MQKLRKKVQPNHGFLNSLEKFEKELGIVVEEPKASTSSGQKELVKGLRLEVWKVCAQSGDALFLTIARLPLSFSPSHYMLQSKEKEENVLSIALIAPDSLLFQDSSQVGEIGLQSKPSYLIGRMPSCDIMLEHASISREVRVVLWKFALIFLSVVMSKLVVPIMCES